MKKLLFSLILLLVSYVGFSQKGLSYQAVILDPNAIEVPGQDITGQPLVNGDVWMKFSIYNGSTLQFEEMQKTKTDGYGLVNLMIGSVSTASFNALVWDASHKTLQVHVSFNQGASYTKVSDQKLNYNPYALFAETAGKLGGVLAISGGGTGATTAADARLNLGLDQVNNTSDAAKPVSTATKAALDLKANATDVNAGLALKANSTEVTAALALKANTTDMTAALAAKADTGTIKTFVVTQVAAATIADADANTKGKIKLSGDLSGTADAPTVPALALKANTADVTTGLGLKANTSDMTTALALKANSTDVTTALSVKADTAYVLTKVAAATIADADANTKGKIKLAGDLGGTAAAPTVPGLALKANAADMTTALALKANTSSLATVATSGDYNDLANKPTIAGSYTLPTASASTLGGIKVGTNLSIDGSGVLNANISSGSINATSLNTGTITATRVNTPIYVSTPQTLTDASVITWDPSLGLNANVTLGGNRTLSFSSTPPSGSYGTIVITQDATGGRTITLPLTTNKVLGSTSTTSIALSTAAGAKDILNFYYDGTNCYWNIGQGYGTAATAASTNLATSVSGTLAVANGGTGATTLTGLVKGAGTSAFTSAVAGTDYLAPNGSAASLTNFPIFNQNTTGNAATVTTNANLNGDVTSVGNTATVVKINGTSLASLSTGILKNTTTTGVPTIAVAGTDFQEPITLTTTGTGAATLSGTTLNIPAVSSTVNAGSISGTIAIANGGTGLSTTPANGQIDIGNGTGFSRTTLTAGSGISITNASGAITIASSGAAGVPYSGANQAVDLGAYDLTVNGLTIGKGKKDAGIAYQYNSAIGVNALSNFSGGTKNTALGHNALASVTSTDQNIAIGVNAMGSTTQYFQQSVAVGNQALQYNQGSFNTALGANSLSSSGLTSAATYLVGVGALALWNNTSGQNNTGIGSYALGSNTTGNNNSALGQGADVSSGNLSNATAIGYNSRVSASNTIQLGNTSVTNVNTSGTVTAGAVTYPSTHGTSGQVLTTTGSGTLTFATPALAKPISDQFTATAAQTSFTLTQTPITNTTVSPNVKPNVWMYINGIRTNNSAYSIIGTTVTYTAASNNNYTIVVGDRIQFDYAY